MTCAKMGRDNAKRTDMPYLDIRGTRIHYTDEGSGPETVVFSHGLLMSGKMFEAQVEALKPSYRCITFDHRGQGQSAVAKDGYGMDALTLDAKALIEELGVGPCHFVGLSMGGFVGMRLAARYPGLLRSLTLIDTSAEAEPEANQKRYGVLNFVARWFGLGVVAGQVMPIMFGRSFMSDPARAAERKRWRSRIAGGDRIGITRAVRGVIERNSAADEIKAIDLPVLVLVGDEDVATVPEKSEQIRAAIAGSEMATIAKAGHSSTVEQPDAVNARLLGFLSRVSAR